MKVLGIDVGGTGIKGAPVDTTQGKLIEERQRLLTPQPSTPEAVAECIAEIAHFFKWDGRIGCGIPSVVKKGLVLTAANIDHEWIGADARGVIEAKPRCKTTVVHDADAAGLAEVRVGAGSHLDGAVRVLALRTGV